MGRFHIAPEQFPGAAHQLKQGHREEHPHGDGHGDHDRTGLAQFFLVFHDDGYVPDGFE